MSVNVNSGQRIKNIKFTYTDLFHFLLGFISSLIKFGYIIMLIYFVYQVTEKEDTVQSLKDLIVFMFGFCLGLSFCHFVV
ncbi:MAG: hypothetical protein ACPL3B_05010, partial [Fervidobacterium sp.]